MFLTAKFDFYKKYTESFYFSLCLKRKIIDSFF